MKEDCLAWFDFLRRSVCARVEFLQLRLFAHLGQEYRRQSLFPSGLRCDKGLRKGRSYLVVLRLFGQKRAWRSEVRRGDKPLVFDEMMSVEVEVFLPQP